MLDVRRMRVLREVALRGSFSAAAEALSFTQSAVSQQIAALEREAGTVLVQRSARGVRLTQAGEAVVRHAEAILARLAEAEAELEAIAGLRGGRLRLAAFESAASSIMPLAIATFSQRHPAVELSMTLLEPEDALPMLRAGELDLAITFESRATDEVMDGISLQHLLADPMFLVLPSDHPLAHKRNLRLGDVASDAWISGSAGCECNRLIMRSCAAAGFDPRIAFETDE
jgi:DNA-binding transcriptional LysR family regulator